MKIPVIVYKEQNPLQWIDPTSLHKCEWVEREANPHYRHFIVGVYKQGELQNRYGD